MVWVAGLSSVIRLCSMHWDMGRKAASHSSKRASLLDWGQGENANGEVENICDG